MTRRLLRINSVSVRSAKAPNSSIHRAAGNPIGRSKTSRNARINSRLETGLGAQMFIGPERSSRAINHSTARQKSVSWIQRHAADRRPFARPAPIA